MAGAACDGGGTKIVESWVGYARGDLQERNEGTHSVCDACRSGPVTVILIKLCNLLLEPGIVGDKAVAANGFDEGLATQYGARKGNLNLRLAWDRADRQFA